MARSGQHTKAVVVVVVVVHFVPGRLHRRIDDIDSPNLAPGLQRPQRRGRVENPKCWLTAIAHYVEHNGKKRAFVNALNQILIVSLAACSTGSSTHPPRNLLCMPDTDFCGDDDDV